MREVTKIEASHFQTAHLKRVAAYARVSSGKDAMLHSLSAQVSYYNEYIGRHREWEFAGIYADEAISGTKDERPEFQHMLSDCRDGKIDMIIAKSITRFARNTVILLETIRELKLLGVDIYFEKENFHTIGSDGEFVLTLLAMFAQEEARSASENQRWKIQKMFEQGIPNTGNIYGYHLVNGKLEIIPEEAEIVKQIFADYLSGMGRVAIVKKLRDNNVPTRFGGQWRESNIYKIIRNETYVGNLLLQKTYRPDFLTKKSKINHGEMPMYQVIGSHEAIIDEQTFAKVQAEIARRNHNHKTHEKAETEPYPFTGLIRCNNCGTRYKRKIANAGGKYRKPVWICTTFNSFGKEYCASQQIPEDILLELTQSVLRLPSLDGINLKDYLEGITVLSPGSLRFMLKDGSFQDVTWQNRSRSKSWTPEMRQKAREKQIQLTQERRAQNGDS